MKILCIKLHKARSRSWVISSVNTYPEDKFSFYIDYFYNGNVKTQRINGNYRMNFPGSTREVLSGFQYDNSNRLLGVYNFPKFYSPLENFSYDKDGNLQTLTRDYSGDNFSYQYYSGTSKLKSIDGGGTMHYSYDYNGNVTDDLTRNVSGISYDSRNLPVEMTITPFTELNNQYKVKYRYDESGNRIRKMLYKKAVDEKGSQWMLLEDKVYIHPVTGEEYAVYNSGNIDYYNIYAGSELICKKKITPGGKESSSTIYYYFKDHLGNIRAVIDGTSGTITQAQDYDAWGDICRTYTSAIDTTVNKFTGKERDQETGYDYFGARYYDSRVSVWLSPDPLFEKHIGWSPYNYVLRNPFVLIDPDGRQINFNNFIKSAGKECVIDIKNQYEKYSGLKLYLINGYLDYDRNIEPKGGEEDFRKYLISAIEKKIQVEYSVDKTSNTFPGGSIISLAADEGYEVHGGLDNETFGPALSLYDEILHTNAGFGTDHTKSSFDAPDQITDLVNKLRAFAGKGTFGQRTSYLGLRFNDFYNEYHYIPMDEDSYKILKNYNDHPLEIEGATHLDLRLLGTKYLKKTVKINKYDK